MLVSSIPSRFPHPFGNSAGGGFIRTIPDASQIGIVNGAASLTDGFPPLCFSPIGSGGVPPFGQDFNGILKQITQWSQWQNAGAPIGYDSAFSTSIGGYPKGAVLAASAQLGNYWLSLVDNNASNPDSGGANWVRVGNTFCIDSGAANAYVVALPIVLVAHTTGLVIAVQFTNANTGASTINTGPGVKNLKNVDSSVLVQGEIIAGMTGLIVYNGTFYELLNPANQLPYASSGGAVFAATGMPAAQSCAVSGANRYVISLFFEGNYNNTNATLLTPIISFTVKDGVGGTTMATPSFGFPAGGTIPIAYNDRLLLGGTVIMAAPPSGSYSINPNDAESDGGTHAWSKCSFTASASNLSI